MTKTVGVMRAIATATLVAILFGSAQAAVGIKTSSPRGEVQRVRQVRVTFDAPMVPLGDPRLPAPMDVACTPAAEQAGSSRWVDDRTWIWDFTRDLGPGARCTVTPRAAAKSVAGDALPPETKFEFSTGGPAVVRATPSPDEGEIEEDQAFALLLNGPVTAASVQQHAWCEISGLGERVPVKVWSGPDRDAIVQAAEAQAQAARLVVLSCARPAPPESQVTLVWGRGIAAASGGAVVTTVERRLVYRVRKDFTASFTCQRENARMDCLPILPLRVEFSSPVPRRFAEQVILRAPDGVHPPRFEQGRGRTRETDVRISGGGLRGLLAIFTRDKGTVGAAPPKEAVTAVEFAAPVPENADLAIELPKGFADESGRPLSNAGRFPLHVKTTRAPALAKFPGGATFGILELNAEPVLPLTVRHVEGDLGVKALTLGGAPVKDLDVTDDAGIIQWMARVRRYNEHVLPRKEVEAALGIQLPPTPPQKKAPPGRTAKRYGQGVQAEGEGEGEDDDPDAEAVSRDPNRVETRSVSLLDRESSARRVQLPPDQRTDPHPFEVVGIPLAEPGYHVVEVASPRLGQALLDREAPMYVRTGVLVTNLGVHFKHGAVNSLVWVTTLDHAAPVADAEIRVSDCRGQRLWQGRTDSHGLAAIDRELSVPWDIDCPFEHGLFISARKTDARGRHDLAFVWSSWQEGIESWRFNLRSWEATAPDAPVYHTVLDRTLLRAGQTVSFKHYGRRQLLTGLGLPPAGDLPTTLRILHEGSGQKFEQPIAWRAGRWAENTFRIPDDAKLGVYDVQLTDARHAYATGQFRVEEFRLPVMTGRLVPPKGVLVAPSTLPVQVEVAYGNGGGAANLPVRVSAQLRDLTIEQAVPVNRYPGFSFAAPRDPGQGGRRGAFFREYVDEDDESSFVHRADEGNAARLVADKRPLALDAHGAGQVVLDKLPPLRQPAELLLQATYADPNGEIQTLSQTVPLWPAGVVLGVRADEWVSVGKTMRTQVLALDPAGRPKAGVDVHLHAVAHRELSARKRLVGGFYAYDNRQVDEDQGEVCQGRSDARGLVFCEVSLSSAGQVELVASADDGAGHTGRGAASVWITGQDEIWFGSQNDDRMDVVPERRTYQPGEIARFQVRSPFRHAMALVTVERNGVISTFEQAIDGKDPTVEVKVADDWAPNVFVSVLAVRGRVVEVPWYSFFTWGWRTPSEWWRAWRQGDAEYQAPTAMVDLSKPAFKLGIAEIEVGRAGHELKVQVTPDKASYPIRATSHVKLHVALPDGRPAPAGTEVAVAAVDEALLSLMPNDSWKILDAMLRHRGYGIETSTAQMQIIGKRHFGKKAAPAGGGGGQFPTRELFDTLLTWQPRVTLDAQGDATIDVPLNDALTSFRIVAVADAAQGERAEWFGTGQATIRATQDLQVVSGVPPLVREGDHYTAMFTLRNTTAQAMTASLQGSVGTQALPAKSVPVPANGSAEAAWEVDVPFNVHELAWTVGADAGPAHDRMKFTQKVAEAVPVRVQQATLVQLDKPLRVPVAPPATALADASGAPRGGLEVTVRPRLGDGLGGVRDFFHWYPWSCLEQQASVAIGLHDPAQWKGVMSRLPLYLDADGLANYFPPASGSNHYGSDSLTAYLLSISDEASAAGDDFRIPDDARETMERALGAFVEGRLSRDFWRPSFLKDGDLAVRKLAALEALSRHGKATPRLLESIQVLPNQWPTGAVIDWLQILQRMPDAPDRARRIDEAEQVLRARLNVQGTRLGFSTERDDNWWWLMANGDVNSVRLLLAVMDRPGWKEDMPRLVTGALQRQQFGRWSTTVSNVWGTVAMQSFSRRFEKEPVAGVTRAALEGGAESRVDWAKSPTGGVLALPWPPGAKAGASAGTFVASQEGTGRPWLTLTAKAAVPVVQPFSSGYRITKTITPVETGRQAPWKRGDTLRVTLKVDVQADATWVVLNDPVPAGATILGSGLGRDDAMATRDEKEDERGWLAYQERSFEAFRAYYRYLPKGEFVVEYTMRLNNPGRFGLPATHMEAMYSPEMFGEVPNGMWTVTP